MTGEGIQPVRCGRSGKEHPLTLISMNDLAEVLSSQGSHKEAEPRSSTSTK